MSTNRESHQEKPPSARRDTLLSALWPACREVAKLQSQTIDPTLPRAKRLGLRLHLLVCRWCRRYGKHIQILQHAAQSHASHHDDEARGGLAPEARERITRSLRDQP